MPSRHDVSRSATQPALRFDDQFWPTNVGLLVWGGIVAAIFIWLGGFNDPHLWRNGVIRLLTLLATITILITANNLVHSPIGPRLRLAAIGSLILHTALAVGLYWQALAFRADPPEVFQPKPGLRNQVFPRLASAVAASSPRDKFEQPVEVNGPTMEEQSVEIERSESPSIEPPEVADSPEPPQLPEMPEAASSPALPEEPQLAELQRRPVTSAEISTTVDQPEIPVGAMEPAESTPASNPLDVWQLQQEALVLRRSESVAPNLSQQPIAFEADILEDLPVHSVPRQHLEEPLPSVAPTASPRRSRRMFVAVPVDDRPAEDLADSGSTTGASSLAVEPTDQGAPESATSGASRAAEDSSHTAEAVSNLSPGAELMQLRRTRGPLPFATEEAEASAEWTRPSVGGAAFGPTRNPKIEGDEPTHSGVAAARTDAMLREDSTEGPMAAVDRRPKQTVSPDIVGAELMAPPPMPEPDALATSSNPRIQTPADIPKVRVRQPAPAFSHRGERGEGQPGATQREPATKTELAIERGLDYLAKSQLPDGSWSFHHSGDAEPTGSVVRADAAATGLALLAFFGAGYDHFDGKHAATIDRGIEFLVRNQTRTGSIVPDADRRDGVVTHFYSHGIATLALCEAYGMTGDAKLREPAQRAIDYIASTQHPQYGGWRYTPGVNADLSVTGWQLTALRSGQLAGLEVRDATIERIRAFVERCRDQDGNRGQFRYNPWASAADPATRHGLQPSTVMTSVGLLMDLYLGRTRSDRTMQLGADHLLENPPELDPPAESGTLRNPGRDTYYWYYATQVMFHMGGDYWREWHGQLHGLITRSQVKEGALAGSWDPVGPMPDKWAHLGGRVYVTSLNLLSLEVSYRYLPLYEIAARGRRQ